MTDWTIRGYDPDAVAQLVVSQLERALAQAGRATLAVSGGRSPGPAVARIAASTGPALRGALHLFWIDERAVPAGHPDRNDAGTLQEWRSGRPLPAHVHPMPAEADDLESAAAAYDRTIRTVTEDGPLDVCLFGIGEDGHLASLFPGHPGLGEHRAVFPIHDSPKPPPRRLTLSLATINRAQCRVVLVQGAQKGAVAWRAFQGPDPAVPASLLELHGTIWFLDEEASGRLRVEG